MKRKNIEGCTRPQFVQTKKQICLVCSARETVVIISQILTQLPGLFLLAVFSQPSDRGESIAQTRCL